MLCHKALEVCKLKLILDVIATTFAMRAAFGYLYLLSTENPTYTSVREHRLIKSRRELNLKKNHCTK